MRERKVPRFSPGLVYVSVLFVMLPYASAQSDPSQVTAILREQILPPQVAEIEMKAHVIRLVANPPSPSSATQWDAEAQRLRARMLATAFHGWPQEWVNSPPRFEDLGVFATEKGYRLRKLRYEIVPGFQSTAILYEPENLQGKMPAILNVNGHDPSGQGGGIQTEALHHLRPARHSCPEHRMAGNGRAAPEGELPIGLGRTWIWWARMKSASSFWPCAAGSIISTTIPMWTAAGWG